MAAHVGLHLDFGFLPVVTFFDSFYQQHFILLQVLYFLPEIL
jgi:hypothetical protein